jgi:hypothetical protein
MLIPVMLLSIPLCPAAEWVNGENETGRRTAYPSGHSLLAQWNRVDSDGTAGENDWFEYRSRGDIIKIGQDVLVGEDEVIRGDVVAIGGGVTVFGEVTGDVVAIGKGATVKDGGEVQGDVINLGGSLIREPGGFIHGQEVGIFSGISPFIYPGSWKYGPLWWWRSRGILHTLCELVLYSIIFVVLVFFFPGVIRGTSEKIKGDVLRSFLAGFLFELIIIPVFFLLIAAMILFSILTIGLGIPVALLALITYLLGVVLLFVMGFCAVARTVGEKILTGLSGTSSSLYYQCLFGILGLLILNLAGSVFHLVGGILHSFGSLPIFLNFVILFIAWTTGFGAIIRHITAKRKRQNDHIPVAP